MIISAVSTSVMNRRPARIHTQAVEAAKQVAAQVRVVRLVETFLEDRSVLLNRNRLGIITRTLLVAVALLAERPRLVSAVHQ